MTMYSLFKNKLCHQWGVYFDVIGIEYEHIQHTFNIGKGRHYTPDFYLPQVEMFACVKEFPFETDELKTIDKLVVLEERPVLLLVGAPNFGSYYSRELNSDYTLHEEYKALLERMYEGVTPDDPTYAESEFQKSRYEQITNELIDSSTDYVINGYHGYLWNEARFFNNAWFNRPPCEENRKDFLDCFNDGKTEKAINAAKAVTLPPYMKYREV